jgi:hypothetical protein
MKKLVLLIVGGLCFHMGHAQDNSGTPSKTEITEDEGPDNADEAKPAAVVTKGGFYLSPHLGAGISKVNPAPEILDVFALSKAPSQSAIFCFNASLNIGYRYKNWRIESGIEYLTSGYQMNNLNLTLDPDPAGYKRDGQDKYKMTYSHVAVPLRLGYVICPNKKLSLVPYVGVLVSYNMSAKSAVTVNGNGDKTTWSKADFDESYNRVSIWGTANLYLEYRLSNKISLFGGPSFKYMFSNMAKTKPNISAVDQLKQRSQTTTIDLGIHINL